MNIGFDGKRAANNLTGLGNYSRSLIGQLARYFHQNHYFVYSPKIKDHPQISSFFEDTRISLKLPQYAGPKFMWRSYGIKKQLLKDKIALFHGLSQEIPFGLKATGIKSAVTIHDLIYLRYPQYYKPADRYIYHLKARYACINSDRIIAISECTKRDIVELYQIDPSKIEVIYQSCDDTFKQEPDFSLHQRIRAEYQLPEKYILNVGTVEPRKNLMLIIKALKDIDPEYTLVVVGKHQPYAKLVQQEIERLNLSHRVIFLQGLPFSALPSIYQMAGLFIYPSYYEGFGIPIIEAMYSNVPVIGATGSCLEEAGGPDSLYVHPDHPEELAEQTNRVLGDKILQQHMKAMGQLYVQKFNNQLLAKQMMDCYLKILK
jgi:glycosyltransferase involved in cell wall biosynthesis